MQSIPAKRLFLIDGFGALVSALFLGVVLVGLGDKIGMPKNVLHLLAILPIFFAIYSFSCYFFLKRDSRLFLKGIAALNLLYCCLTIGLLLLYDHKLTLLGWTYFVAELLVLAVLIFLEFKASSKNT